VEPPTVASRAPVAAASAVAGDDLRHQERPVDLLMFRRLAEHCVERCAIHGPAQPCLELRGVRFAHSLQELAGQRTESPLEHQDERRRFRNLPCSLPSASSSLATDPIISCSLSFMTRLDTDSNRSRLSLCARSLYARSI